ncbi:MAG: cell division protein ZipA C-terminal FtsZ-binding domain-containing protein [Fimbriimonas sp.]|nr:cell division protein ZipA C-terminal FtsZ-binding domain-containing protein [Fimbriimonas sp.]
MTPGVPDFFGQLLEADPEIALQPFELDLPLKAGPLHKIQYVIEFVGQRSVLAGAAAQLLAPDWYQALGHPLVFAMRPADLQWQRLTPAIDGSYDSLAMSWPLLGPQGAINHTSAKHLLELAERFGPYIQRRAMAMPVPREIDAYVRVLKQTQESLDIGFEISVLSSQASFAEKDLWVECARLGLSFSPTGSFDWRVPSHPSPLFSVTPIGQTDAFSLANVQRGATHVGVTVGFSVPLCPAPTQAAEGAFYAAEHIARELDGRILDDSNRELSDLIKNQLLANLREAISLFAKVGMTTGSSETMALFGR